MRTDTIDTFLHDLAARAPAPGGGATAAMHAAQAAALLGMVARYSEGEKFAQHATTITGIRDTADELRARALDLAEQDAEAFGAVGAAYRLPKSSDADKAARSRAIAAALADAGRVPARVIAVADRIVDLAERLRPIGNANVLTDVAAAADAARAAASTSRTNVEVNLAGITDAATRTELGEAVAKIDDLLQRADETTSAVRERIMR